jgi:hypothetical protein
LNSDFDDHEGSSEELEAGSKERGMRSVQKIAFCRGILPRE